MNGTLSIEDRDVAGVLRFGAIRGTSLNQAVRDFLHDLTAVDDVKPTVAQPDALGPIRAGAEESYRSQEPWTRVRNCMSGGEFPDTNVPLYAHDARHPRKRICARELLRRLLRDRRGRSLTEAP